MPKIRDPVLFSDFFKVDAATLSSLGVLDPTLNVDTALFLDPMLLEDSVHQEINTGACKSYEAHFGTVIKFLRAAKSRDDVAWRSAQKLLTFPEIKWTCLGYGSQSVSGSGSGQEMTGSYVATAKQIVELGVDDPDLFAAMALFEKGVGPDRISDMTTNVIFEDLLRFNHRAFKELAIPTAEMHLRLANGKTFEVYLPANPFIRGTASPVMLVPSDVLRKLPIASDWHDVADAASHNEELRQRVNSHIAALWAVKSRKDKDELRRWALSDKEAFGTLLDMIRGANPTAYDLVADSLGEIIWRKLAKTIAEEAPFQIKQPPAMDLPGVVSIVSQIIEQFRFLIEDRRYSEELYHAGRPRPEKSAQRLFYAVAHSYCKANNLDLTPEADTGNGPVDFKLSSGFEGRVVVEIKLSTNGKVAAGYTRQLEAYKVAEQTLKGYYIVLDVGKMGKKAQNLIGAKNAAAARGEEVSDIVFIDGTRRLSASKLS